MAKQKSDRNSETEYGIAAVSPERGLPSTVTLFALSGFGSITFDGVEYKADAAGRVRIPAEHVETAKSHFLSDIKPG